MLKHIPKLPSLLTATFSEWRRDRPPLLAAGIAYYAFFSIIPVLVVAAAIGSLFFGQAAVDGQLTSVLNSLFGEKVAGVIQSALVSTYSQSSNIVVAVAAVLLLLGASYVFVQLRNALNIVWKVKRREKALKGFVEARLVSLVMVVGIAVLLLAWIIASIAFSALYTLAGISSSFLAELSNFAAVFIVSTMLFAMTYKLLPSVRLTWGDVWLGSMVTAFLFTTGWYVLGFYLSRISIASLYGAAGSMVALLMWLYLSAHIFVFGAVFTKVFASRHGSRSKARKP